MSQSLPIKQLVANTSYLRLQQPLICITCIVPSYLFPQVKQTCLSYLPYILLLLFHHGACDGNDGILCLNFITPFTNHFSI